MAQQLIDFGSFPDDPTADAIRTAFQKTQQNFAELYSGAAGQAVYSVNRTPGAGITVNAPTGNVVVTANIACVQVETSTLSIGITANGGQNAVYTQSNQVLVIDLPNEVINIKDITISGNLTANRVTANIDMYTGTLSATGNANVANLNSANNVTGTNLTITNGMMSGNLTLGNLTMAGTVKSHLIPSPPNTQNLGNATNNWNVLYAQDIYLAGTPISGIGKVVPSFGNVYLPSNVSVVGTTAGTATTVLTFTFPNSGYYRVNTLLIADPAIAGTPTVSFALFDNTGTLVPNSEIMMTTATGGISQKLTGTGVIDIQVSGAVSYTVRAWGLNTPNILNYGVDGRSSVNWLKLDPAATISTTGNVTYGNLTVTGQTSLNTLTTSSNANINANLNVSGNAIISGNLTVDGNIVYVNVEDLSIEDPIINLQTGPNGSPLVANSGKDVGVALNYFTSSPKVAWMGWDNSAAEITFGEEVTIASEVVSYTKYANIRAGNIMGPLANGSSNITIVQNANINFAVNGNGNRVEIGEANSYFNNQLWANSNIYIKNTGALIFQDDDGSSLDTLIQYNNTNNSVILNVNGSTTMESNISNTFFNSPLTANANLVIPNGNRIIFVDDVSTNNDTGINYNNTNDSLTITVNGVETIKSNVANTTLTGNVIISGNLAVDGNITYINTETLAIEDPIIQLQTGPNGAAPTSNSGKDIGTALNYYDSAARVAFMGWDTSGEEFGFASRATITNEVVAFDTYGNIRAGNVIARLANGTSNIYIEQNGPVLFSAQGTSNVVNVAAAITHVNNQLYANNNMFINNTGAGAFLYFVDNVAPSFFDTYIQYDYANPNLRFYINSSQKLSLNSAGANILNGNLTIDSGDAIINGGDILSNQALFNILPANATTITLGLAATSIDIGSASGTTNINNNLEVDGDILLKGGDFDVSTSSANLWTGNATTVNAFSVASTLNVGATGGVITLANPTLIGTQTTQNVYNNTATTVNAFGEAATLNIGNTAGTVTLRNPTLVGTENTQNVYNTVANTVNAFGFANVINMGKDEGTMTLRNPTLVGANVTQNVYNTTATTVNAFGTAATLNVGVDSGTVTLRNPTLVGANVTQNVYNTVAATVNAFGDANVINIGKDEGIMTLRNPTIVGANVTQNLFNTVATTVNFAGSATNVNIASSTGNTTVKNNLVVNGNLTVDQDIIFSGCDIDANCVTLNVFNNIPQTINLGANASTLNIGNTTGTATLRNPTLVGTETTQNVYNTVANTVNAFGFANVINMGKNEGTMTLRNPTLVGANATQNVYNTTATTVNAFGDANSINIGTNTSLTTLRGNLLINKALNFVDANGANTLDTSFYYTTSVAEGLYFALNGSTRLVLENDRILEYGDIVFIGGNLDTTATTVLIANANSTTVNAFGVASTLNMGATTGTATLRNPTLVGTQTTQNVYDTVATTVNAFGAAGTLNIGNNTGTATLRNPTLVGTETTQNVYNTTATTVNTFGAAGTLNIGNNTGTVTLRNPTLVGTETTQNVYNTTATTVNAFGTASTLNLGNNTGTATLRNPTLVGTETTQNVYNTTATTVNAFGAAATLNVGVDSGTVTLRNPTLVGANVTQNVYNTTATTVNAFGAAATLNVGVDSGTVTLRNPTLVGANVTQNVYNTIATTVNAFGDANSINIGTNTSLTTLRGNLQINKAINFVDSNSPTTDTSIYYASDYLGIALNGSPDKITIENTQVVINDDLAVKGGDITTNQATFNILNGTATTVNAFGAASTLNMGATTGTATLRNPTLVGTETTQNIYNTTATTVNAFGAASTLNMGTTSGTATLRNPTLVGTETTQNIYNTTATTVNAFGAATNVNIGNNSGTMTLRNPTIVGTEITQNLFNSVANTINFGGAANTIEIGAATGNTNINHNLVVDGNLSVAGNSIITGNLTIQGNLVYVNVETLEVEDPIIQLQRGPNGAAPSANSGKDVGTALNYYNTQARVAFMGWDVSNAEFGLAASATITNEVVTFDSYGDLRINNLKLNQAINFADANASNTDTSIYYNVSPEALVVALNNSSKLQIENTRTVLTGDVVANTGNIETVIASVNIANANSTTVNAFGAASTLNMGATTGTATLRNPTLVGTETTQNVYNTTATTVNAFGAASTLNLGATSGTATINNPTVVGSQATQNLFNTAATTMNFAGAATTLNTGAAGGGGTFTIRNDNVVMNGDLQVQGGDLTTTAATFNLLNATATTINFAGAATTLEIGAASGTTNINNNLDVDGNALVNGNLQVDLNGTITGDLAVNGGDITTTSASFNLVNATATTVNFAGAGTDVNIGASTGNTTIKNNLVVTGNISLDADIILKGCDLNTDCTTFNLINANATTVFFAGAATSMNIGANGVSANIRGNLSIDKAINFNTISSTNDSIYYNSATFNIATGGVERLSANATVVLANANLQVTGTEITTNAAAVNLANTTTTTINFGGAATTLNIGAATGNTTIKNNLIANANIETVLATLNLANANSTTVNFAGAGTAINIGAATGNTTVNHNLIANGNIETKLTTLNLANANSTTINFGGAGTAINIGAATGNTTVNHNLIANGNIETKLTTLNLANANSTTINFGGAGTQINVGASTGNTKVNNNLIANGNIETVLTTLNLANANSTTVNFAGAGTNINIGASSGNTTIKNNLIANGNIETVLATLNLANANSTTINFGGAATTMKIGKSGTSYQMPGNLAIDKSINFNTPASLNDAIYFNSGFFFSLGGVDKFFVNASGTTSNANLYVNGTDIITTQSSFNIANTTATTINLGRAASQLNFGASGSNSAFSGNVYVTGNINVNGGGIDGPATMNIGSTSSTIQMGSSGGVVTMNGNANVTNLNASANVVATTAVKTGSITLNGGNGFIYTSGDITGNTISASGLAVMYPNGLITGASVSTGSAVMYSNGTIQASLFSGSGASLSSLPGANVTGTVANATYATSAGSASTATSATSAGFATNSGYATSAGTAGFASCAGALVGSGCDVAEFYAADEDYEVGTVLEFGGDYDVTLSSNYDSHKVAGVISTEPGVTLGEYVEFDSDNKALLALIGRVPTKVIGPVEKGDLMVSAPDGYAIANNMARAGTIIGKSLENFYGDRGVIDIVVGRH